MPVDSVKRLEKLISKASPRVRRRFLEMVASIRNNTALAELAESISAGSSLDEVLSIVEKESVAFANGLNTEFSGSATATASFIDGFTRTSLTFNQARGRAVRFMEENQFRLVTGFSSQQRDVLREALIEGLEDGLSPKATARLFRSSIGLTRTQQQAVRNFKRMLREGDPELFTRALRDRRFDPTVRRALAGEIKLTDKQINKMVDRYRDRFIRLRSETIARTETQRSIHEGNNEMYEQAIEQGFIDGDSVVRIWINRGNNVRPSHIAMHKQRRGFGETFTSGNGHQLLYPGDLSAPADETINCKCGLKTQFTVTE